MRQIFFDECGNTGQNLIDEADPIFVLASCSFTNDEEQELLSHFQRLPQFNSSELKFTSLRKSPQGQKAVLDFLGSAKVTSKAAAVVVFHKPFMVVTKYCDLVLEPSMREAGVDFYKSGANIATANLLTTTMPVFLNPVMWSNFLALFVRVIRERTPKVFYEWRKSAELIYSYLEYKEPYMAHFLAPVFLMNSCDELFKTVNPDELDPIVPAYYIVVNHWGTHIGSYFELISDESKVLAKERDRMLAFSNPNLKSVSVGYDRRKMNYPLKVSDIIFVDSTTHRQVQIADILSGAIANAAKARTKGELQSGTFARDVFELCFAKELIIDAVWPNHEVTPEELGTDKDSRPDDVDAATYAAMIMKGHPLTKKVPDQKVSQEKH